VQADTIQAESDIDERPEAVAISSRDMSKRQRSSSTSSAEIPSYPPAKRVRTTQEAVEPIDDPKALFLNEDNSAESVRGYLTAPPLGNASEDVEAEPPDDPIADDDLFGDYVDIPDDEPEESLPSVPVPPPPVPPPPPSLLPAELPRAHPPLPSHRARATQPLVKMIGIGEIEGEQIVQRQSPSKSVRRPSTVPATNAASPLSQSKQSVRTETPRGLPARNSSLLTFGKGGLKTLKRANVPPPPPSFVPLPDILPLPETDIVDALWGDDPQTEDAGPHTASSDELLKLAGYNAGDAAALPDFEDIVVPETPEDSTQR
jgi:hypothetical protein